MPAPSRGRHRCGRRSSRANARRAARFVLTRTARPPSWRTTGRLRRSSQPAPIRRCEAARRGTDSAWRAASRATTAARSHRPRATAAVQRSPMAQASQRLGEPRTIPPQTPSRPRAWKPKQGEACFDVSTPGRDVLACVRRFEAMANGRAYLAEFLGTFFLCFAGIGAILSGTPAVGAGGGLVAIALAHGLALSVAVSAFGGISGAHFNPAVTIGMAVTQRIGPAAAGVYILVQLVAAVAASLACRAIFPAVAVSQGLLGVPLPQPWVSTGTLILAEAIMTFLLMIAIYGTAIDESGMRVKICRFGMDML